MRIWLILLSFAVGIIPAFGQQPAGNTERIHTGSLSQNSLRFEQLAADDGLSSQTGVYAVIQDRKGFIWIGTWVGLNRYDGYTFTHYQSIPFDSTSIASDLIHSGLYEDRSGAIWVGNTTGELNRLDPLTGDFTHWKHIPGDTTSLSYGSVTAIHERQSGDLWVGTQGSPLRGRGGLNRMNRSNGTFTRYLHDPDDPTSLSNNNVRDLFEDDTGRLWISTANGLNRMDSETGTFTRYLHGAGDPNGVADDPGNRFTSFYAEAREPGIVWIGSKNGFVRFDTRSGEYTRFVFDPTDISKDIVSGLVHDPRDEDVLWIATKKSGLYRYDTRTGRYANYRHEAGNPNSLSSNGLHCIYGDRTGIIWLCAEDQGVIRFDPAVAGLVHYGVRPDQENSLSVGTVHGIMEDRTGALWIGVGNDSEGLNRIDRKTGRISRWKIPSVNSIVEDRSRTIWVGSLSVGLNRWDPDSRTFTSYRNIPGDSTSLSHDKVWTILEDRGGSLWVGTFDGLNRMKGQTGEFVRFMHDPDDSTTISSEAVVSIYEDHAGVLWVGTLRGGLNRLDRETGKFTRYQYNPRHPGKLSSNAVWCLWERPREPGILWIGTGGGLNRLDTRTGTFTHFTEKDGRPNNSVWGILEDEQGRLWLSRTGGLSRFDPKGETFRNFGVGSGLPSVEFKDLAFARSRSGELFFGGVNGLLAFYPEQMRENPHPPQISLTGIRLFNRPVVVSERSILKQPISMTEEIQLRHNQNSITFEYVALHFRSPAQNRYAFQLEGFDRDWVQAGAQRGATYTNLDPGSYTFRVKGANSDGIWNEEGAAIRVVVLAAWWRTWWAYTIYCLLFLAGAFSVDRVQRRRLIRREQQKAQDTEARLRAEALQAENRRQELELEKARELEVMNARLQEQARLLVEMDGVKARFFANISHEFRTPLTLILGPVQDALRTGRLLDERHLDVVHRSARRLLRLINQLLDLSRFDGGHMEIRPRQGDIAAFLRKITLSFASRADREAKMLTFSVEPQCIIGGFDGDKLDKIVSNLLSNAFKFTPTGGKIAMITKAFEDSVSITVSDTGPGIPAAELPHLFDRFYQIDSALSRRFQGFGIGLSLVKELVELLGGTIEVESQVGFGSSFSVMLPLLDAADGYGEDDLYAGGDSFDVTDEVWTSTDDAEDEYTNRGYDPEIEATIVEIGGPVVHNRRPRVLVDEDNVDVRAYLRGLLAEDHDIIEAQDGREGLSKAREVRPDLVIADIMMPDMDGLMLTRAIRDDSFISDVPIIILTAKADLESRLEGFEQGADDYLAKPFDGEELLARVESLIEIRRRLRRKFSNEVLLGPNQIIVTSDDAVFMERIQEAVESRMGDAGFGVEQLADEMALSSRQLQRRLKSLTNLSAAGYIRMMRLARAAQLLEQQSGQISEIADRVGYRAVEHFSRIVKRVYGVPPSAYGRVAP